MPISEFSAKNTKPYQQIMIGILILIIVVGFTLGVRSVINGFEGYLKDKTSYAVEANYQEMRLGDSDESR